jgi:hypothetical protein
VVASAYAADDDHPVKAAVDRVATARGWRPPDWARELREDLMPLMATVERAAVLGEAAGLRDVDATHRRVGLPGLTPEELVAWRLGMAPLAPFVGSLRPTERRALVADARVLLGAHPPPLVRSVVVLTGRG